MIRAAEVRKLSFSPQDSTNAAFQCLRAQLRAYAQAVGKTPPLEGRHKGRPEGSVRLSPSAVQVESRWQAVGILGDITQRKRMEHKLQESGIGCDRSSQAWTIWSLAWTRTKSPMEL